MAFFCSEPTPCGSCKQESDSEFRRVAVFWSKHHTERQSVASLLFVSRDEEYRDEELREYEAISVFWSGVIEMDIGARSFFGSP
jgi:hypothetical protein